MEDRRLIFIFAYIKEAITMDKAAQELRHLPKKFMLADGLTKRDGLDLNLDVRNHRGRSNHR